MEIPNAHKALKLWRLGSSACRSLAEHVFCFFSQGFWDSARQNGGSGWSTAPESNNSSIDTSASHDSHFQDAQGILAREWHGPSLCSTLKTCSTPSPDPAGYIISYIKIHTLD